MVNVVIWLEKAITCVLSQHVVEYLSVWIDNFEQGIDVNSLGTGKNDCFNFTLCIDQGDNELSTLEVGSCPFSSYSSFIYS